MIKKSLKILLILSLGFLLNSSIFANVSIPVENVFLDINKDYIYYNELQTLYDKWIIKPEDDNKFNPDKLLNRDEFVGIALETSCKKCISPNTSIEILNQYKWEPFFDVWLDNKYFYCISDAKENDFVLGYNPWVKCNDGTFKDSKSPFCTKNNIKLEEALAVVMRMWWIMTASEANEITSWIKSWKDYPDLAIDLLPIHLDGTVNSFYPYFKKALDYEVIDYDALWNKKTYKLIEKKWEYLRPDTIITKQDFLNMAFVALKSNSCSELNDNELSLKIKIFDKSCDENKSLVWKCDLADFKNIDNTLDFDAEIWWTCEKWVDDETWYTWRFVNESTWKQILKYGKFIDDYDFLSSWNYKIFFRVKDKCWNTWEIYNTLSFNDNIAGLKVSIDANPIIWNGPLEVDFKSIINWWGFPYEYKWSFWDWASSNWEIVKHTFIEEGTYEVTLNIIDNDLNTASATLLIKVLDNVCSNDFDSDWINDCEDICPLVNWDAKNNWCPIFIEDNISYKGDTSYKDNTSYEDSILYKENIFYDVPKCLEKKENSWFIFWNVVCSSCPCDNSLDFRAILRECDTVIPAITSPSEKDIYVRWKLFQISK